MSHSRVASSLTGVELHNSNFLPQINLSHCRSFKVQFGRREETFICRYEVEIKARKWFWLLFFSSEAERTKRGRVPPRGDDGFQVT